MRTASRFTSGDGILSQHHGIVGLNTGTVPVAYVDSIGVICCFSAVLFMCHGVAEHIERHDPLASTLAEKGFLVVGHDHGKTMPTTASCMILCYACLINENGAVHTSSNQ